MAALVAVNTMASTLGGRNDDQGVDDMTMGIHIQQFIDEWHYRVLHAGVANDVERQDVVAKVLELFECHGMRLNPGEKEMWSEADEDHMISLIVSRLPPELRKTFEHFTLQLQVVMSTATRVRHALEEGYAEDLGRIFEDKDSGLSQDVLKQVIVEAGAEARELMELNNSWRDATSARLNKLVHCAGNAEYARQQLEAVGATLDQFGGEQREKSKKVLLGLAQHNEEKLMSSVFRTWWGHTIQSRQETAIRAEFQNTLDEAHRQLISYQSKQLANVRGVMGRKTQSGLNAMLIETVKVWRHNAGVEKSNRALAAQIEESETRLRTVKRTYKDVARRTLLRLTDGARNELQSFVFQVWSSEAGLSRDSRQHVGDMEQAKASFEEQKLTRVAQTRSVLQRICTETEVGLMTAVMQHWNNFCKEEKREFDFEEASGYEDQRFRDMTLRLRFAATNWSFRASREEDLLFAQQIMDAWSTELQLNRVMEHYLGRANQKRAQLDAVQDMFKDFANQLEKGLGNSPRTDRRNRSSLKDTSVSPNPAAPALMDE